MRFPTPKFNRGPDGQLYMFDRRDPIPLQLRPSGSCALCGLPAWAPYRERIRAKGRIYRYETYRHVQPDRRFPSGRVATVRHRVRADLNAPNAC